MPSTMPAIVDVLSFLATFLYMSLLWLGVTTLDALVLAYDGNHTPSISHPPDTDDFKGDHGEPLSPTPSDDATLVGTPTCEAASRFGDVVEDDRTIVHSLGLCIDTFRLDIDKLLEKGGATRSTKLSTASQTEEEAIAKTDDEVATHLRATIVALNTTIAQLAADIRARDTLIDLLNTDAAITDEYLAEQRSELDELRMCKKADTSRIAKLGIDANIMSVYITEQRIELDDLRDFRVVDTARRSELETDVNIMSASLAIQRAELDFLHASKIADATRITQLNVDANIMESRIAGQQAELEDIRASQATNADVIARLSSEIKARDARIAHLSTDAAIMDHCIAELRLELEDLRVSMAADKARIARFDIDANVVDPCLADQPSEFDTSKNCRRRSESAIVLGPHGKTEDWFHRRSQSSPSGAKATAADTSADDTSPAARRLSQLRISLSISQRENRLWAEAYTRLSEETVGLAQEKALLETDVRIFETQIGRQSIAAAQLRKRTQAAERALALRKAELESCARRLSIDCRARNMRERRADSAAVQDALKEEIRELKARLGVGGAASGTDAAAGKQSEAQGATAGESTRDKTVTKNTTAAEDNTTTKDRWKPFKSSPLCI